ncbi:hypothetical protein VTJ04DRAFT_9878 [Mycothermus thermophilus]|uniref:uncharacterized protein n=1 Tax=Humicola insolens TaxID=85995 RepID=UPI0037440433
MINCAMCSAVMCRQARTTFPIHELGARKARRPSGLDPNSGRVPVARRSAKAPKFPLFDVDHLPILFLLPHFAIFHRGINSSVALLSIIIHSASAALIRTNPR